jgi:pentatricopeptide repeat protein
MLQDPRGLLQLAEERRRSGRLKEAIAVCLDGLARHPTLDAMRVTLGRSYLESGQVAEAREALQDVYDRHPDHHLAGKLLAEALNRLGDPEGAATVCRELLRHYPRDRDVEAILASVDSKPSESASALAADATAPASDPSPDYLPEDVASASPVTPRPSAPPRPQAVAPSPRLEAARAPSTGAQAATPEPARRPAAVSEASRAAAVTSGAARSPQVQPAAVAAESTRRATGPTEAVRPVTVRPEDALQTNTLADLYLKQGLVDRALEVYRGMLRLDPGNELLRRKVADLETRGDAPKSGPVPRVSPSASAGEPVSDSAEAMATTGPLPLNPGRRPVDARGPNRAAIARLEGWLETIRSGSSGSDVEDALR